MSKLSAYIDNMFIGLPDTEEVESARQMIQENMTERYQALIAEGKSEAEAFGNAVGEFGSIEELADEMGWQFLKNKKTTPAQDVVGKAENAVNDAAEEVKSWGKTWNSKENTRIIATLIARFLIALLSVWVLDAILRSSGFGVFLVGAIVVFVSFYRKSPLYLFKDRDLEQDAAAQATAQNEAAAKSAEIKVAAGTLEDENKE